MDQREKLRVIPPPPSVTAHPPSPTKQIQVKRKKSWYNKTNNNKKSKILTTWCMCESHTVFSTKRFEPGWPGTLHVHQTGFNLIEIYLPSGGIIKRCVSTCMTKKILFLFTCMCLCIGMHASAHGGQKEHQVSWRWRCGCEPHKMDPGNQTLILRRAASALSHVAISPASLTISHCKYFPCKRGQLGVVAHMWITIKRPRQEKHSMLKFTLGCILSFRTKAI